MKTFIKMVVSKKDRKKYISLDDMISYIQELTEKAAKNKNDKELLILHHISTELDNLKKSKH